MSRGPARSPPRSGRGRWAVPAPPRPPPPAPRPRPPGPRAPLGRSRDPGRLGARRRRGRWAGRTPNPFWEEAPRRRLRSLGPAARSQWPERGARVSWSWSGRQPWHPCLPGPTSWGGRGAPPRGLSLSLEPFGSGGSGVPKRPPHAPPRAAPGPQVLRGLLLARGLAGGPRARGQPAPHTGPVPWVPAGQLVGWRSSRRDVSAQPGPAPLLGVGVPGPTRD